MAKNTQPKLVIVAAVARNLVIGNNNTMPWHLPEDLQHFKQLTLDTSLIIGGATFRSLPKILPKRYHIVITQKELAPHPQVVRCTNVEQALAHAFHYATKHHQQRIMIGGGGQIYRQLLPLTDFIELTEIDAEYTGDTFFPQLDDNQWHITSQQPWKTSSQGLQYRFLTFAHTHQNSAFTTNFPVT